MEELAAFDEDRLENETFSKRLVTGAAAEGFFEASFPNMPEFRLHALSNVTRLGCGFDFRVQPPDQGAFIAVEVKGIAGESGEVVMTSKEHRAASYLEDRFFLRVVRNYSDSPVMSMFRNPLKSGLGFPVREQKPTMRTWPARISA